MQTVTVFVLLFCLQTISLAQEVTVYHNDDYHNEKLNGTKSQLPWEFVYNSSINVYADIFVTNQSPSVTAFNITYNDKDGKIIEAENNTRLGEFFYQMNGFLSSETNVTLHLYKCKEECSSLLIAHGRNISKLSKKKTAKTQYRFDLENHYDLVIDLKNKCDETKDNHVSDEGNMGSPYVSTKANTTNNDSANDTNNLHAVFMYVIPPLIAVCVIILAFYLRPKIYRRCNSRSEESIEMDTYVPLRDNSQTTKEPCETVTAKEVLYADLSFAHGYHGDSQASIFEKESPYAQIVGVLKPADVNI